jgi:lactate dehydrogenase-like 2-hydroxyacid dehydrogenase
MRVLAVKANPAVRADRGYSPPGLGDPDGTIPSRIAPLSDLADLFREPDYAVLTLPFMPATERVVDEQAIRSLPPHAVLINIVRGRILDEVALCAALHDGALGGAVLDVATTEHVPPASPLWEASEPRAHAARVRDPGARWMVGARGGTDRRESGSLRRGP